MALRAAALRLDGPTGSFMIGPMLVRRGLPFLLLLTPACQAQCGVEAASKVEVAADRLPKVEVKVDPEVHVERTGEREVEVEVEPTVCDALDFEVERIVLVPADPPFHDHPRERVSLRITNHGATAVELGSGTEAVFLDERRTVVDADVHEGGWFMPRVVPATSTVVVQVEVPEGAGKALRTVEAEAAPEGQPFSDCKVVDDLRSAKAPAGAVAPKPEVPKTEPPAEAPSKGEAPAEALEL